MARRAQNAQSGSPQLPPSPAPSSSYLAFPQGPTPRAPSPSGLTQFLTKPAKWFGRKDSNPRSPAPSPVEPRLSTSSGYRKPKISQPTDPRPILNTFQSDSYFDAASRSAVDVSQRPSLDALNVSSASSGGDGGLGDLRNISRKPWSRSADDLGKIPGSPMSTAPTSFQEKIAQYRSRSVSNAAQATSPPRRPNAILIPPPPSVPDSASITSSPRRQDSASSEKPLTTPIIYTSPPLPLTAEPSTHSTVSVDSQASSASSHLRSQSHTPRQVSRLTSALPPLSPISPRRKGSAQSEQDVERNVHIAVRNLFPFGGSSSNSGSQGHHSKAPAATTQQDDVSSNLLSPHARQDSISLDSSKRSSQVMHQSSFINKLAEFSPPTAYHSVSLAKGWKPYKLELKGTKLCFYKPSSDRTLAIKELFPIEFTGEEDDVLDIVPMPTEGTNMHTSGRKRDDTFGRRKRAYWGRATHPDLVVDQASDKVKRGNLEALVHEIVFATTTLRSSSSTTSSISQSELETRTKNWHDFASAVLLCLPLLADRYAFETEFQRCCTNLVNGAATDEIKEAERGRVAWLIAEYMRLHGLPVLPKDAWDDWKNEILPVQDEGGEAYWTQASSSAAPTMSGMPKSSSTRALHTLTPQLGSLFSTASPNLGTFSPRPDATSRGVLSLADTLGLPSPYSPVVASSASSIHSAISSTGGSIRNYSHVWDILEDEGLTKDVLMMLEPNLIALSLRQFHQCVMAHHLLESMTVQTLLGQSWPPPMKGANNSNGVGENNGISNNNNSNGKDVTTISELDALFGSDERPHWLTRIVLHQILSPEPSSSARSKYPASPSGAGGEDASIAASSIPTSRTHSRSELISAWARVGEMCRLYGDECSWQAIAAALCSRPVARLEKSWKRVDVPALKTVQSWVTASNSSRGTVGVQEPRLTVWGGKTRARLAELLEEAVAGASAASSSSLSDQSSDAVLVSPMMDAKDLFEGLRTSFDLCPRVSPSDKEIVAPGCRVEDVLQLAQFWNSESMRPGRGNAAKFTHINHFMSLSFAAEPRRKGLYEPHFWTHTPPNSHHVLTPLLFPESLPSITLIDRSTILRTRVPSDVHVQHTCVQDLPAVNSPRNLLSDNKRRSRRSDIINMGDAFSSGPSATSAADMGGTVIHIFDGELVVVVQSNTELPSRSSSRAVTRQPSTIDMSTSTGPAASLSSSSSAAAGSLSRGPSIRVKTAAGASPTLDRKSSVARRSSLPALSKKSSFIIPEPSFQRPLRVRIQAGTLERLVHILAHGLHNVSVSVADDNGEMALKEGRTRELSVDHDDFASVWWRVFRSFVSPIVFFELLQKRWKTCVDDTDHALTLEYRSQILDLCDEWMTFGDGAQDAVDDPQLFSAVHAFLSSRPSTDDHFALDEPEMSASLEQRRKSSLSIFMSQTARPSIPVPPASKSSSSRVQFGPDAPNIDRISPEELVDNLDAMLGATFGNISEHDMYVTSDLFEVQTADRLGWFNPRDVAASIDDVEIQTLFLTVMDVPPSEMIPELGQDALYRLLPPSIRSCIRAHAIIRKWLVSKLAAPRMGPSLRQTRAELLLRALAIARLRSRRSDPLGAASVSTIPCVRSFVEAVIISALVSVESRSYSRLWQNIAYNRGTNCDTLAALLPSTETANGGRLTVDLGWLLERILELISLPDIVTATVEGGQSLINFEKRRHLRDLIHSLPLLCARDSAPREYRREDFERLSNIEKEVHALHLDIRAIRDDAHREALQTPTSGTSSARKPVRPFAKITTEQVEKHKRDKQLRDWLSRAKRHEEQEKVRREDHLNKAMARPRHGGRVPRQHRNKNSMSAFFQFMRPISSAFTSETLVGKTPAELDFTPSGKPTLAITIVDAKASVFSNDERPYVFRVDAEDGGHYLLQALNRADMNKWIETINKVAKLAAKRRLTYIGKSPIPQLADHVHDPAISARNPTAVFGVSLENLLVRETGGGEIPRGAVPRVLEVCLHEVESRGLTEVGIYRLAGGQSQKQAIIDAFNRGEQPITDSTDINAVCDVIKTWFRQLPEAAFPSSVYHQAIEAVQLENLDQRLLAFRKVIHSLPIAHFDLVKRIFEHLDRVTDYEENNQMTAEALAIVFSPNLLRGPNNDLGAVLANMGYITKLVKTLITHFHVVFDDNDGDDGDAEYDDEGDDFEEPILEEDEEDEEEHADVTNQHGPFSS